MAGGAAHAKSLTRLWGNNLTSVASLKGVSLSLSQVFQFAV